ncbi:MAG: hypothetical protein JKY13_00785, partial [Gammaproteobacteria bacterium]|nr:hypothetical protein [Gammaproteobacteria bacterium]
SSGNIILWTCGRSVRAQIIDFSSSQERNKNDDTTSYSIRSSSAHEHYSAPECVTESKSGFRSDIYSLTCSFLGMFGAYYPSKYKKFISKNIAVDKNIKSAIANTPFCFEGLFKGFYVPPSLALLKPLITLFFVQMSKVDYAERAETENVVRFFALVKNCCDKGQMVQTDLLWKLALGDVVIAKRTAIYLFIEQAQFMADLASSGLHQQINLLLMINRNDSQQGGKGIEINWFRGKKKFCNQQQFELLAKVLPFHKKLSFYGMTDGSLSYQQLQYLLAFRGSLRKKLKTSSRLLPGKNGGANVGKPPLYSAVFERNTSQAFNNKKK